MAYRVLDMIENLLFQSKVDRLLSYMTPDERTRYALAEKVDAKARVLGAFGPRGPSLDDLAATETELWRWYFCDRLGRSVPSDLHLFARGAGFAGVDEMRAAALRDLTWERSNGNQGRDGPARG